MFAKFKSALYNVVGNFDPTEGGTVGNLGTTVKFPYTRPHFLQLNSEDEILVTADHALRPIICPRDISRLPWNSGYAETINAGKSKRNEDQSAVHVGLLTRVINPSSNFTSTSPHQKCNKSKDLKKGISSSVKECVQTNDINSSSDCVSGPSEEKCNAVHNQPDLTATKATTTTTDSLHQSSPDQLSSGSSSKTEQQQNLVVSLPYYYFGVFDGHAGWGAAVSAANELPHIIHEKLCDVIELIIPDGGADKNNLCGPLWSTEKTVSPESAVIGALEQAFWVMDLQIGTDRHKHHLSGGCTACVALFILGKVFVANAGDSRGIIGMDSVAVPMSFDFTPETETHRIRKLGARHPELLGGEFTHLEFLRRPLKSDVGKRAAYRDHYMKGWSLKTITESDLKYPLVCGEGKRSRVLATIGVTRGFGDHDLKAQFSSLPIKPFLSPEPEVRVFDMVDSNLTDRDVLILGTDGLWDIMSNEKTVTIVSSSLHQFPSDDSHKYKYRYTSAAHDLVLSSRGRLKEHNWRTSEDKHATIDDISVFVIPLLPYKTEFEKWQKDASQSEVFVDGAEEAIRPSEVIMMPVEERNKEEEGKEERSKEEDMKGEGECVNDMTSSLGPRDHPLSSLSVTSHLNEAQDAIHQSLVDKDASSLLPNIVSSTSPTSQHTLTQESDNGDSNKSSSSQIANGKEEDVDKSPL